MRRRPAPVITRLWPSGEKPIAQPDPAPSIRRSSRPLATSQSRTARSAPIVARVRPSGAKAGAEIRPALPPNLRSSRREATSQRMISHDDWGSASA